MKCQSETAETTDEFTVCFSVSCDELSLSILLTQVVYGFKPLIIVEIVTFPGDQTRYE